MVPGFPGAKFFVLIGLRFIPLSLWFSTSREKEPLSLFNALKLALSMTTNNLMEASKQWANRPSDQRFETLQALRDSVNSRRMRSRSIDLDLPMINVTATADDSIAINHSIAACEPSHWAFNQFAGLLKAPASYLRALPTPLLVDCLNHGLKSAPRDSVKFMTIANANGEGMNRLQAVTSPTYGRIWDADCVDAVSRLVERSGGKFHNPLAYGVSQEGRLTTTVQKPSGLYASDRDCFMFMIDGGSRLEIGPRAKLNRGFFVSNSEVGARTFTLTTFLFNEVCGNHIVWGASNVNTLTIRHSKGGPYRFDSEAAPTLLQYCNESVAREEGAIRAAQDILLPKDAEQLEKFLAPFKFTKSEVKSGFDFAKAEEGECRTVWQFVQGLTAYARGFDFIDARTDLERRAGSMLNLGLAKL